jgi:hypothetical protein
MTNYLPKRHPLERIYLIFWVVGQLEIAVQNQHILNSKIEKFVIKPRMWYS